MAIIVPEFRPCDVCRLLDGDVTPKPGFHCNMCDSWICKDDSHAWVRRAKAAIKRKLEPTYKGDPNYTTGIENANHSS